MYPSDYLRWKLVTQRHDMLHIQNNTKKTTLIKKRATECYFRYFEGVFDILTTTRRTRFEMKASTREGEREIEREGEYRTPPIEHHNESTVKDDDREKSNFGLTTSVKRYNTTETSCRKE